jgi:hypothetical protein
MLTEYDVMTRSPEQMSVFDLYKVIRQLRERFGQQQILAQAAAAAKQQKLGPILNAK